MLGAGCILIAYGPSAVFLLAYAGRRSALLVLTIARYMRTHYSAMPPNNNSSIHQQERHRTTPSRGPPLPFQRVRLADLGAGFLYNMDCNSPVTSGWRGGGRVNCAYDIFDYIENSCLILCTTNTHACVRYACLADGAPIHCNRGGMRSRTCAVANRVAVRTVRVPCGCSAATNR